MCVETPVFSHDRTVFKEMHPMVSSSYSAVDTEAHDVASTPDNPDCVGPMQLALETKIYNAPLYSLCTSPACSATPVFMHDTGHFIEIKPVVSAHESIREDVCEVAPAATFLKGNCDSYRLSAGDNVCLYEQRRMLQQLKATDTILGNKKKHCTVVRSQLDRLIGSAPDSMSTTNKKGASSGKTSNKSAPEKKQSMTPGKALLETVSTDNTTTAVDTKDSKTKPKKPMHKTKAALAAEYKILGDKRKRLSGEIALIAASVRIKESMLEYAELVCRQEEHKQVDDTAVAVRTHKKRGVKVQKVVDTQAKTDDEEEEQDDDDDKDDDEVVKANDDDDDEEDDDDDADDAEDGDDK